MTQICSYTSSHACSGFVAYRTFFTYGALTRRWLVGVSTLQVSLLFGISTLLPAVGSHFDTPTAVGIAITTAEFFGASLLPAIWATKTLNRGADNSAQWHLLSSLNQPVRLQLSDFFCPTTGQPTPDDCYSFSSITSVVAVMD